MIKATDYIYKLEALQVDDDIYTDLTMACQNAAYKALNNKRLVSVEDHIKRISKLANRFEREFLRANKKPKFIILHGTDIKEMDILTWNTGCDVPYYENAVFESKEEANRFADLEEMDDFTIVEVLNEN